MSTPLSAFEEQMRWLSDHAKVLSVAQLIDSQSDGLQVALTFDDGYQTLYSVVQPILQRYGFAATVFVNPAYIQDQQRLPSSIAEGLYDNEQFLLWPELVEMSSSCWEIGSHGLDHIDLTCESDVSLIKQVNGSREEINSRLAMDCRYFSYTWGHFNEKVKQAVKEAGYQAAFSGIHAAYSNQDLFEFPRIDIRKDYSLDDFEAVVRGDWDYLGALHRLRQIQ
jgi:peptidoglycan/xylan/chitin deacetylase (PgdA/CDA1 family)